MTETSINGNKVTIAISGHLDTNTSAQTEQEIRVSLQGIDASADIIIDATNLDYISSTGLRVMLSLKKSYAKFHIINLKPEVYDIFEMTGFSRIINVSKALRHISIANCEEIGRGGVGIVYRLNEDTIIKVFTPECSIDILERERIMAKESFVLGMPTAIPYDTVWVPETKSYGLVFELINAGTLASAIKIHPERLDHYAKLFGTELRHMHSIHVPDGTLPLSAQVHEQDLQCIARHFLPEQVDMMREMLSLIPADNRLLHNDCHPKNMMLSGTDENEGLLIIDMGEVSSGHPLIELSHTYSSLHIKDNFEAIIGFPKELAEPFWQATLKEYLQSDDAELIARCDKMIAAAAVIRSCMWIALSDFPEETIRSVRQYADETLLPQREYLLGIAKTFHTFPCIE